MWSSDHLLHPFSLLCPHVRIDSAEKINTLTSRSVAGVGVGYGSLALFFRRSSREIQRLNSIFRSSLYAHFAETLSGVATIRAYGETHRFNVLNRKLVDDQNRAYLLTAANESWLAIQLNNLGSVLVLSIALMCATQGRSTGASQIALVLTYMSSATGTLAGLSVIAVELENTSKYTDHNEVMQQSLTQPQ